MKKTFSKVISSLLIMSLILCGCSKNTDSADNNSDKTNNTNSGYTFFDFPAFLEYEYSDGKVHIYNAESEEAKSTYSKNIKWKDSSLTNKITKASQKVVIDGEVAYEQMLNILNIQSDGDKENIIYTRCKFDIERNTQPEKVEVYIDFIDSENIEYQAHLLPPDDKESKGSTVYIIDKDNEKELWYK